MCLARTDPPLGLPQLIPWPLSGEEKALGEGERNTQSSWNPAPGAEQFQRPVVSLINIIFHASVPQLGQSYCSCSWLSRDSQGLSPVLALLRDTLESWGQLWPVMKTKCWSVSREWSWEESGAPGEAEDPNLATQPSLQ